MLEPVTHEELNLGKGVIVGVDEVGRGALFGPVIAAAVILPPGSLVALAEIGVTDSKQLKATQRETLAMAIRQVASDYQIGAASVQEIDRLNILQASLLAMKRAVQKLRVKPELCLVDGNQLIPQLAVPQQTVIKGDQKVLAIAAASIIAKVWRDKLITRLASKYPGYDLAANKGYGSVKHRLALQELGSSSLHRRSFNPCQIYQPRL